MKTACDTAAGRVVSTRALVLKVVVAAVVVALTPDLGQVPTLDGDPTLDRDPTLDLALARVLVVLSEAVEQVVQIGRSVRR